MDDLPDEQLLSFKSSKSLKKKQALKESSANLYHISETKNDNDAMLLPSSSVKKPENFLLMTGMAVLQFNWFHSIGKFNFAEFAAFDIMLKSEGEYDPLSRSTVTKLQTKPSAKGIRLLC
jgi:hypothetical protein